MNAKHLLIFDDDRGVFGPMTQCRAAFELRTGAALTRWRIEQITGLDTTALVVPQRLGGVVKARYELPVNEGIERDRHGDWLVVNGRWAGVRASDAVKALRSGQALLQQDGQLVAACVEGDEVQALIDARFAGTNDCDVKRVDERLLIERPWHILDELEATLERDGSLIDLPSWRGREKLVFVEQAYPFKCAESVVLKPGVVIDTSKGPVYLHEHVVVGSHAVIEGPVYIGSGSQVAPHALIRPQTVVGPVCKVAGEISFSILHGYSNKGHAGFLGHSLVGQWVNFGADTTVSNLKNTYNNVRVQLDPHRAAEDSGRVFHGPIVGDYVRTAIGTRLLTGSSIGTGAMLASSGYPPKCVEPFTFHTETGVERYQPDKFIETARAMMARRNVALSSIEEAHLRSLMG